jgi:hypothetical protein
MIFSQWPHARIALIASVVAALAVANWILEPTRAPAWLASIATMAVIWIVVLVMERARSATDTARRFLFGSAETAGVVLSISLVFALLDEIGLGAGSAGARAQGVVMGVILMAMGNIIPKIVSPLGAKPRAAARAQAMQTFAGRAFFIAGLGYAGVWLLLAPGEAKPVALTICATATALVIARMMWMFAACGRKQSPT